MASTVREEFIELILTEKLMEKEDLAKCCEVAGFKLEDLVL